MERKVSDSATLPGDLGDLRAFCLVADLGSITAAARTLHETKGGVSRRITRLESALGVSLLRRSPRLVAVTEDGAAFRVRVGRALEILDDAAHALISERSTPRGLLRLTAPTDFGALLAPLVSRFIQRFPEVRVEALLTQTELDFDAHQLDIALRATGALRDSSLIARKLLDMDMGFYASPAYLEKHRAPRKPADLADHSLLLMRFRAGEATLTLHPENEPRETERVVLHGAIMASDAVFVREAALAGGGIAVLPNMMAEQDLEAKRLVRVLKNYRTVESGGLYLLHSASPFLSPKVRAFRDFVVEQFETQCASRRPRVR